MSLQMGLFIFSLFSQDLARKMTVARRRIALEIKEFLLDEILHSIPINNNFNFVVPQPQIFILFVYFALQNYLGTYLSTKNMRNELEQ